MMVSMLIWFHSCKKQNDLINILKDVYSDAQYITYLNENFSSIIYIEVIDFPEKIMT
jgi:hypothetical protein